MLHLVWVTSDALTSGGFLGDTNSACASCQPYTASSGTVDNTDLVANFDGGKEDDGISQIVKTNICYSLEIGRAAEGIDEPPSKDIYGLTQLFGRDL